MSAKKAIKELEKQLRKEPDNLVLRLKLAAAYRELARTAEAVALYRSVAVAYHAQGRLSQAIAVCKSVLEIDPSQRETQALLAELDTMRGVVAPPAPPVEPAGGPEVPSLMPGEGARPSARMKRPSSAPPVARPSVITRPEPPPIPPPRGRRLHPEPSEFGPGSGLTPKDNDLEVRPIEELAVQAARLREAARTGAPPPPPPPPPTPAPPPAGERPSPLEIRRSASLLTPTPLPEPLALHEVPDEQRLSDRFPPPLRELDDGRPTLRGLTPIPRRPSSQRRAAEVDEEAMTRIAGDEPGEPITDVKSPAGSAAVSDDALTRVAPDASGEDALTTIAPEPHDDDEALTTIADDSGALPDHRLPTPPPVRVPSFFDRDTRPITGAAADKLVAAARDESFEELPTPPPPDPAVVISTGRETVELPDELLPYQRSHRLLDVEADFLDQSTDRSAERHAGEAGTDTVPVELIEPDEVDPTNPGDRARTKPAARRPAPVPAAPAASELELARAFDRPFADTLARLGPDGAVIDVPLSLFSALPDDALAELARRMSLRHYEPGEIILHEGEIGEACYVIAHGEVRVLKREPLDPRAAPIEVARLGSGALFGEFALLADRRRHATVQAVVGSEIYEIPRRLLRELAATFPDVGPILESFYRERLLATLLSTAPFFKPVPEERRGDLLALFEPRRAESGERVVVEGEPAGGLFLIVLGSVEITKRVTDKRSVLLATLGEGAYFGEMSLLRGGVAGATVTAVGPTELAVMKPRDFYAVIAENPHLWDEVRREANRRQLANNQLVTGETNLV